MNIQNCEVEITQERQVAIEEMATEMFNCPVRRRGRSYEQVHAATLSGKILEYALEDQGGILNPKPFNVGDRDSYCWDVLFDGLRTEVKRMRFMNNSDTKFYSWYNQNNVKTFLKNTDIVEQFIVGDYLRVSDWKFKVEWMFKTKVNNNFKNYIKKSMYNEGQMYYAHRQDPNCEYYLN